MSDTLRVRIVKGADLRAGMTILDSPRCTRQIMSAVAAQEYGDDQTLYLVIDETPGVFLEGVTAEDVESAITGDSDAQDDVFEAIDKAKRSKAAES